MALELLNTVSQVSNNGGAGVAAGVGVFMLVVWGIAIIASIFWIWMLIDCLTSSMPGNEKILWVLVIFFLHVLGAVIYFAVARGGRSRVGSV